MKKIILLLLLPCWLHATNYYFANAGNDATGNGTIGNPYATIIKANALTLSSGDSLLFKRGDVFSGTAIIAQRTGLIYGAYGTGAKPIVTSFVQVSGWTAVGGNIWESNNTFGSALPNMVVIGGVNTPMGRFPDNGTWLTYQSHTGNTSVTTSGLTGTPNWMGASLVIRKHRYMWDVENITAQSGGTLTVSGGGNGDNPVDGFGCYIQNDVRTLTVQNEWFYNTSTQRIRVYSIGTPATTKIATLSNLAYTTRTPTTFQDLDFKGCNVDAIFAPGCNGLTVNNCTINYAGGSGIYPYASSFTCTYTLTGNTIKYCNFGGIFSSSTIDASITGNTITACGLNPGGAKTGDPDGNADAMRGISTKGNGGTQIITDNVVDSIGGRGISFLGDQWWVSRNLVSNFCSKLDDAGGLYTWNGDNIDHTGVTPRTIDSNIVLNGQLPFECSNGATGSTNAGYADNYTDHAIVAHNTFANNLNGPGFLGNDNGDITFTDNVFYNNKGYQFKFNNVNTGTKVSAGINSSRNIFFSRVAVDHCWGAELGGSNTVSAIFAQDSNYFDRPLLETGDVFFYYQLSTTFSKTLATWKIATGLDAHSVGSPRTVGSVDSIRFEYNPTSSPVTIPLGAKWIEPDGTILETLTLPAYSSMPLIWYGPAGAGNLPPVITAISATPSTIQLPTNQVTLSVTANDPDGTIASYSWVKTGGTSTGTITNNTSASTTVTALTQGTITFQVTVTDNLGATVTGTVTVTINPLPAVCKAPETHNNITVSQTTCQAIQVNVKKKSSYRVVGTGLSGTLYTGNNNIGINYLAPKSYTLQVKGYGTSWYWASNFSIKRA